MSNGYFSPNPELQPGQTARASDVMALFRGVEQGFDRLPTEAQTKFGTASFAVTTGAGNAYLAALPYSPIIYFEGMAVALRLNHGNTGPATLNLNGIGAVPILRLNGTPVEGGDLAQGSVVELRYDGAAFRLNVSAPAFLTTVPDGAAATPGLRFAGVAGTGLFRAAAGSIGFAFAGTERVRLGPDGSAMFGTTQDGGEIGNLASLTVGRVRTNAGTALQMPHNTWTLLATMPLGNGVYLVTGTVFNAGGEDFSSAGIVTSSGLSSYGYSPIKAGSFGELRMSGANLEFRHSVGIPANVIWSVLRLA